MNRPCSFWDLIPSANIWHKITRWTIYCYLAEIFDLFLQKTWSFGRVNQQNYFSFKAPVDSLAAYFSTSRSHSYRHMPPRNIILDSSVIRFLDGWCEQRMFLGGIWSVGIVQVMERHLFALEGILKFEELKMLPLQLGHYRYRSRHTFALETRNNKRENLMSTFWFYSSS